jgi:hypothetical protein
MPDYDPTYTSLVASLRSAFDKADLTALADKFQLWQRTEGDTTRLAPMDVLAMAAKSAADPSFDPGEDAHPAVREHFRTSLR